jgi:hypothetical protein
MTPGPLSELTMCDQIRVMVERRNDKTVAAALD